MTERYNIGYYIKCVGKEFEKTKAEHLKKYNLTSQQINVLLYLFKHRNEDINQKCLEKEFSLTSATMSGILKRLEYKNYIFREYKIDNCKEKYIFLSKAGFEIENEILHEVAIIEKCLLKGFKKNEKEQLIEYLHCINENIKEANK